MSGLASVGVPDRADIAVVVVFGLAAAGIAAWLGAPVRSNSLRTSQAGLMRFRRKDTRVIDDNLRKRLRAKQREC